MASFVFVEACKQVADGSLNTDTDTLTLYLIGAQSSYTPDDETTSLTTARGDEIGVSYTPQNVSTTITKSGNRANIQITSPVTFSSLPSGATVYVALLGKSSSNLPVAWFEGVAPKATTGGDFKVNFDAADFIIKNE